MNDRLNNGTVPACPNREELPWIVTVFGDCPTSTLDWLGFWLGLISTIFWFFAQLPQVIKNFRNKSAESLSLIFMACWLAGDITNLVGCILIKCWATQIIQAIYFCIIDAVLVWQCFYFTWYLPRRERLSPASDETEEALSLPANEANEPQIDSERAGHATNGTTLYSLMLFVPLIALSSLDSPQLSVRDSLLGEESGANTRQTVALVIGWISACIYIAGRIPQIAKNFKRGQTGGLSVVMFTCAALGNICYSTSVIIRAHGDDYWLRQLPWLVGSAGTLSLDMTILGQFFYYEKLKRRRAEQYSEVDEPTMPLESTHTLE